MTIAMPDTPKRVYRPWYRMPPEQQPICPDCLIACTGKSSQKRNGGTTTVQYRKCPKCGYTCKTPYS